MRRVLLAAIVFAGLSAPIAASAQRAIGTAERIQGAVEATVAGTTAPLAAGDALHLGEIVATGDGARAALRFDDGTTLTLGEKARVTLDAFVYDPAGRTTIAANVVGAFRYLSGKLNEGGTREATITTPVATIGARGTDFWGGQSDGRFGVVVLEGAVTVTPAAGPPVTLDAAGMGVDIVNGAATPPGIWGAARRTAAIATVSFE